MMLIRHDKAKISRLRTFLQWKDVRRNVKDSEDKSGGDAADIGADADIPGVGASGPDVTKKTKRAKVDLVWDVQSFFSEMVPARDDADEDEEESEMNYATLQRLKNADERTKNMTREEYVHWSDCRQASFTFRKGKRFREWAGFGVFTDSKPSDDIIDILGFLTFEIVQTLTEEALRVKDAEDLWKKSTGVAGETTQSRKRKREGGLFDPPEEAREPVQPSHVREAYRRLQKTYPKSRAMLNFTKLMPRTPLKLVSPTVLWQSSHAYDPQLTHVNHRYDMVWFCLLASIGVFWLNSRMGWAYTPNSMSMAYWIGWLVCSLCMYSFLRFRDWYRIVALGCFSV